VKRRAGSAALLLVLGGGLADAQGPAGSADPQPSSQTSTSARPLTLPKPKRSPSRTILRSRSEDCVRWLPSNTSVKPARHSCPMLI